MVIHFLVVVSKTLQAKVMIEMKKMKICRIFHLATQTAVHLRAVGRLSQGEALCVQMDFTGTFETTTTKCNIINHI